MLSSKVVIRSSHSQLCTSNGPLCWCWSSLWLCAMVGDGCGGCCGCCGCGWLLWLWMVVVVVAIILVEIAVVKIVFSGNFGL